MIAIRSFLNIIKTHPSSVLATLPSVAFQSTFSFKYNFSSSSPEPNTNSGEPQNNHQQNQPEEPKETEYKYLTSPEALEEFKELMTHTTDEHLEKSAKLFATLEALVEENQESLAELEKKLDSCSENTRFLIERIQMVKDNIKLHEEEIFSIEKRVEKELSDCKNYSVSSIAKEILDVADSLSKSKTISFDHHKDQEHQIMKAIEEADKEMKNIFEVYGIKEFDPTGKEYDPNTQEALSTTPAPSLELKNKVACTTRSGYTIKGRLLRSAHVITYS